MFNMKNCIKASIDYSQHITFNNDEKNLISLEDVVVGTFIYYNDEYYIVSNKNYKYDADGPELIDINVFNIRTGTLTSLPLNTKVKVFENVEINLE